MTSDLSLFYQSNLSYTGYVASAYGVTAVILGGLMAYIFLQRWRLSRRLRRYEKDASSILML